MVFRSGVFPVDYNEVVDILGSGRRDCSGLDSTILTTSTLSSDLGTFNQPTSNHYLFGSLPLKSSDSEQSRNQLVAG